MKQGRKLTRDQKIQLAKEGKNPKDYLCVYRGSHLEAFVRKDGKQDDVADRTGECGK